MEPVEPVQDITSSASSVAMDETEETSVLRDASNISEQELGLTMDTSEEVSFKRRRYLSTIAEESGESRVTLGESRVTLGESRVTLGGSSSVAMDENSNSSGASNIREPVEPEAMDSLGESRVTLGESRIDIAPDPGRKLIT